MEENMVVAQRGYEAGNKTELSFAECDLISYLCPGPDDLFFMGKLNGKSGLVPISFVQELPGRNGQIKGFLLKKKQPVMSPGVPNRKEKDKKPKPKKKPEMLGLSISGPTSVTHVGHLGFTTAGFEARNLPPELQKVFSQLNALLKENGLKGITKKEAQFLVKLATKHLGEESAPAAPSPPATAAPSGATKKPAQESPQRPLSFEQKLDKDGKLPRTRSRSDFNKKVIKRAASKPEVTQNETDIQLIMLEMEEEYEKARETFKEVIMKREITLKSVRQELAELKKLHAEQDNELTKAREQLTSSTSSSDDYTQQIRTLKEKLQSTESKLAEELQDRSKLRKKYHEEQKKDKARCSELESELEVLRAKFAVKDNRSGDSKEKVFEVQLEKVTAHAKARIRELEQQLERDSNERLAILAQHDELKHGKNKLEDENRELQRKIRKLEGAPGGDLEPQSSEKELNKLKKELRKIKEEEQKARQSLVTAEEQFENLKDELTQALGRSDRLEKQLVVAQTPRIKKTEGETFKVKRIENADEAPTANDEGLTSQKSRLKLQQVSKEKISKVDHTSETAPVSTGITKGEPKSPKDQVSQVHQSDEVQTLLASIRAGKNLKKVEKAAKAKITQEGLLGTLAQALLSRRADIAMEEDQDEDDEQWDNE